MDILRDKLNADKKLVIAENLTLTESQAAAFWPVYDEYQQELEAINQRLAGVIKAYAAEYNAGTLSDSKAKELLAESIAIEKAETALKDKYIGRLDGVIPTIEMARYIQMENKIRALIKFELAANIPLAD
jgi:hypothetical protein